ncbi:MAG: FAD-dependent 5-carboxymethylaminomethyl-2-thiouridine(34) oxidoreductase MnmC [Aquabacterium sp.]
MSSPLQPATLSTNPSGHAPGVPYSPLYDDVYHAVAGAWAQARHVFLGGNDLPSRWQGRSHFVILETGFGLGNNFLATWSAWLDDPARCDHLVFISVEKHPLTASALQQVHQQAGDNDAAAAQGRRRYLGERLAEQWPVLTPGWHQLRFEITPDEPPDGQAVTLMLGLGDVNQLLPELMASVDAFYLDGFAPAKNPDMWQPERLARLNRLAAPGATAATWSSARMVRDGLTQAGFVVERAPGFAGKRDMVRARYAPRFHAPPPAGGLQPMPAPERRRAVVVGSGLAGAAAAWALCKEGWQVTVLDRQPAPGAETSGNPGGLFHAILHGEDGIHARAHRAAALATWRVVQQAIDAGVQGAADGLIRLEPRLSEDDAQALLEKLGCPTDHARWLSPDEASAEAGVPLNAGGWLFEKAGWVHPAGLIEWMLHDAQTHGLRGSGLVWRGSVSVSAVRQEADGEWAVLDADGVPVAQAPTLVLACAHGVAPLLNHLPPELAAEPLPTSRVRGQVSWGTNLPGSRLPHRALAGQGYALALDEHTLLFGATTQHDDEEPAVRLSDQRRNWQQAQALGVLSADSPAWPDHNGAPPTGLQGRVGWRAATPDRLPLVGALPCAEHRWGATGEHAVPHPARRDQVRMLPRLRDDRGGLYVLSGLGSRGITWSVLAGQLLAHWVAGTPCPIEASLRDALDPARFLARRHRQPSQWAPL